MEPRLVTIVRQNGLAAALVAGAFVAGASPIADGDIYWHLAAGREMVQRATVLTSDPFSVSAAGRSWVDVHWLFQLAAYAVHSSGGLFGLVLAKCALVACGAVVLLSAVEPRARQLFVVILLAALVSARQLLVLRPVIATMLFLAVDFLQLERFREDGRARHLVPLVFVQILWVNVQGLFALGPAVIGAYAVGALVSESRSREDLQALSWVLVACLGASCVSPYGLHALALPPVLLARLVPGA